VNPTAVSHESSKLPGVVLAYAPVPDPIRVKRDTVAHPQAVRLPGEVGRGIRSYIRIHDGRGSSPAASRDSGVKLDVKPLGGIEPPEDHPRQHRTRKGTVGGPPIREGLRGNTLSRNQTR
jgi:hypothetical protein